MGNDLAKEQNASAAALKATFEKEFKEGDDLHRALLKEQERLTETKAKETKLKARLQEAFDHLKAKAHELNEQETSLRSFLAKLGDSEVEKRAVKAPAAAK